MSISNDQKTKEWIDFANMLEAQGITLAEVKRKVLAPARKDNGQNTSAMPARPQLSEGDDFISDMMKIQQQAMKMKMYQEIMRANGLMGNNEETHHPNTIEELKKLIESASTNKFTKDDMFLILMIRMLQSGANGKEGLQISDVVGLMNVMQQKGSTWQDALAFLQTLEAKRKEGIQEGKELASAIYEHAPAEQTFSQFVDQATMAGLKKKIEEQIRAMFDKPQESGILSNGKLDIGEIAKQIIKIGQEYVKKIPAPQLPPAQTTAGEPPPMDKSPEIPTPSESGEQQTASSEQQTASSEQQTVEGTA